MVFIHNMLAIAGSIYLLSQPHAAMP